MEGHFKYLGEFESKFKTALDHKSGDLIGSFDEKKTWR
jgi:hypothetical protein